MDTTSSVLLEFNDCLKIFKSQKWWELIPQTSVVLAEKFVGL